MFVKSKNPLKFLCNKHNGNIFIWDDEFFEKMKKGNKNTKKYVLYTGKSSMVSLKGINGLSMLFYVKPHKRVINLSNQIKKVATIPPVLIRCSNYLNIKPILGVYICIKRAGGYSFITPWPYGNVSNTDEASVCMGNQQVLSFYDYLLDFQKQTNQSTADVVHVDILPYLICIYSAFFDSVFNGDLTRVPISDILTNEEVDEQ